MKAGKRFLAGLVAAVLLCCVLPITACATELLAGITTTQSGDSSYFTHRINGTNQYFFSNVKNGGKSVGRVTLSALSGCSVYQGEKKLTGTQNSDRSMSTHTFDSPGSYSIKIVTPAKGGDSSYVSFAFTVISSPEPQGGAPRLTAQTTTSPVTAKADAPARRIVYHADGTSYITTVTEGARLTQPAAFTLTAGMTATISKDANPPKVYASGTELREPGSYTITFKSTGLGGKEETSRMSFVIGTLEPETSTDFSPGSLLPPNAVSPSRIPGGEPLIGGLVSTATSLNSSYGSSSLISPGGPYRGDYSTYGNDGLTTIQETYHPDFETYEQEFAGIYFYTNVSNGTITANGVTLDIPAGVEISMTKDGLPATFTNNALITKRGSYILTLERTLPDGTTATGIFRFRIQALPASATPITPPAPIAPTPPTPPTPGSGTVIPAPTPGSGNVILPPTVPGKLETEGGDIPTDQELNEMVSELTKPSPTTAVEGAAAYTGLVQTYDAQKQSFLQKMGSGTEFYTSIPNGAVVNGPVYFSFENPLDIELIRDGKPVDYVAGTPIEEHGVYRMMLKESSVSYLTNTTVVPAFSFRIISKPVRDTQFYYPPEGFRIDSATLDGTDITDKTIPLRLQTDGSYELSMSTASGEAMSIPVKLVRDTTAPVFKLNGVENGRSTGVAVDVEYSSDDLERVELFKDGERVDGFAGYTISDPGDYTLKVYDEAGNVSSAQFVMTYRFNVSAILAVLLVVLLVAAGVVFFIRTKKNVVVR